ncbi:cyclin domain-containing protein [Ditylenchus destructor]|uniref:Protein CNPPD1 n=1 Tax=Ditylenchus destructor TaxID=166010 RepID=A0AAD4R8M5_9BILA|nr:cyclin domain-containing protein [Ditylenchus destructor]
MMVDYFDRSETFEYFDEDFASAISFDQSIDPCTFLIAMIYIDRLKHSKQKSFKDFNPSELYLSALILASKFLEDPGSDEFVWNDEWATSSGFSLGKVNELELKLLTDLDWNILVPENVFADACQAVERWVATDLFQSYGFLTYNEVDILTTGLYSQYMPVLKQFVCYMLVLISTYLSVILCAILSSANAPVHHPHISDIMINISNSTSTDVYIDRSVQLFIKNSPTPIVFDSYLSSLPPLIV